MKKVVLIEIDRLIINSKNVKENVISYLKEKKFREEELNRYVSTISIVEFYEDGDNLMIDIYVKDASGVIISSRNRGYSPFISIGVSDFVKKIKRIILKKNPDCKITHTYKLNESNSPVIEKTKYLITIALLVLLGMFIIFLTNR